MSDQIALFASLVKQLPEWARDTRYQEQYCNMLWLRAQQYDHIKYPFNAETDGMGNFNKMWTKRPSVKLNLPKLGAEATSRKLFGKKHCPRIVHHEKDEVTEAFQWLVKTARMEKEWLRIAKFSQTGSSAVVLKVVDDIPVLCNYPAYECWPTFDQAKRIERLRVCQVISGSEWLNDAKRTNIRKDISGDDIQPEQLYWYVREWDKEQAIVMVPVKQGDWNPITGDDNKWLDFCEPLCEPHKFGWVPALWLENLPNEDQCTDGLPTFYGAFDNCINLDYTLSQIGRGGNYMACPQLFVKGKILTFEGGTKVSGQHTFGPHSMLQVAADRRDAAGNQMSGSDAKLIELDGSGIERFMNTWVDKLKMWTLECVGLSRKDPNTIKGQMSGKAIQLFDEDFIDLVELLKDSYGENGFLESAKLHGKMLVKLGHPKFKGVTEEDCDEAELKWPIMYTLEPDEVLPLVNGLAGAVAGGMMELDQAQVYLESQMGNGYLYFDEMGTTEAAPTSPADKEPILQMTGAATPPPKPAPATKPKAKKK